MMIVFRYKIIAFIAFHPLELVKFDAFNQKATVDFYSTLQLNRKIGMKL